MSGRDPHSEDSRGPRPLRPHDEPPRGPDANHEFAPAAADPGLSGLLRRGVKAAIARWAVLRRPAAEWPRPQDEARHAWDGRPHFAEEFVFAAVQPELGVLARIEWLPGRDAHRVWLTIFTPTAIYSLPGGQALLRGDGERGWSVGGLTFDCVEPLRTWTLRFRGALDVHDPRGRPRRPAGDAPAETIEARLDLTFLAGLLPFVPGTDDDPDLLARQLGAAEWDTRLLRAVRRHPLRGYVQAGDLHGTITLGGDLRAFGGAALRVHSWGVRDWGASDAAMQCFATLGPLRTYVHTARFPWVNLSGGFVQRPGGVVPIRDLGVTQERRPGRAPARTGLSVEAPGGPLALEAETVAELPLDMDGRGHLDIALVRVHGVGERPPARAGEGPRPLGPTRPTDEPQGWGLCFTQHRLLPRPTPRPT